MIIARDRRMERQRQREGEREIENEEDSDRQRKRDNHEKGGIGGQASQRKTVKDTQERKEKFYFRCDRQTCVTSPYLRTSSCAGSSL